MKMTNEKATAALAPARGGSASGGQAIKSGLSIVLAVVLMGNVTQPVQVLAASPEESAITTQAVAEIIPEPIEIPSTVQQVLLKVCQDHGFDEICAKHLMGIMMQESVGQASAVGDHGMSHGWFQINRYYNPEVSVKCAEDLECSATWTLNHLMKKGYPKTVKWAIWCHNGCGISKTYVYNVLRKGEANWDAPLKVVTADEHRAAKLALR